MLLTNIHPIDLGMYVGGSLVGYGAGGVVGTGVAILVVSIFLAVGSYWTEDDD